MKPIKILVSTTKRLAATGLYLVLASSAQVSAAPEFQQQVNLTELMKLWQSDRDNIFYDIAPQRVLKYQFSNVHCHLAAEQCLAEASAVVANLFGNPLRLFPET